MGIKKFEEYFESSKEEAVSLKSLNPIIHAMREGDVDEALKLIKSFKPVSGLFIKDDYLVNLSSSFNQREIFDLLFDRKKELRK